MESIITPLQRVQSIFPEGQTSGVGGTEQSESTSTFKDIFSDAINNVVDTDYSTVIDTENLATGDVDDLHTLSIDNMKSYLAVEMLVQLRNKALDSYNQIMQINV
jgi:flagellar hook-basal body complex protein FliE